MSGVSSPVHQAEGTERDRANCFSLTVAALSPLGRDAEFNKRKG